MFMCACRGRYDQVALYEVLDPSDDLYRLLVYDL
jgi:hypothetical protein